jgi:hypothetical protein
VGTKVLVHDGHEWACKCWSVRGMSGHKSAGPLKGMFYPSYAGTLASIKSLVMMCESVCATGSERFAITDCIFFFW